MHLVKMAVFAQTLAEATRAAVRKLDMTAQTVHKLVRTIKETFDQRSTLIDSKRLSIACKSIAFS